MKPDRNLKSLFFLFFLLLSTAVQSQTQHYLFEHYTTREGLSDNYVRAIFKDSHGFLWVGTRNGLNRYDGYEFKCFYANLKDTNSLPASKVSSITEDKNGNVWVASHGGISKYEYATDKFTQIPYNSYCKMIYIFCDSKNRIWASTAHSLAMMNTNGKILKWWDDNCPAAKESLNIFEDREGRLWFGSLNGLSLYREADSTFTLYLNDHPAYTKNNSYINGVGYQITEDNSGYLWSSGWANGLKRFDPKKCSFRSWLPTPQFAGDPAYNVITSEAFFNHKLWVACHDRGLGTFDTVTGQFQFLRSMIEDMVDSFGDNANDYMNMPINKTMILLADNNCLWIGSVNGLWKLDLREQAFEMHKLKDVKKGSCLSDIFSITENPQKHGDLYLATWNCGIFNYNLNNGTISNIDNKLVYSSDNSFNNMYKDIRFQPDGSYWVASNTGLFRIYNGHTDLIKASNLKKTGNILNAYDCVRVDKDSNVWAGNSRGILFCKKGAIEGVFYSTQDFAPGFKKSIEGALGAICEAPNGDLWFLHYGNTDKDHCSITILRKKTWKFETYIFGEEGPFRNFPYSDAVKDLLIGRDGKIWISTERGLAVYKNENDNAYKIITTFDGLIADALDRMSEDSYGNIWVYSLGGVSRIDPLSYKIRTFSGNTGLPGAQVTSLSTGEEGKIFIGFNQEWLGVYNPKKDLSETSIFTVQMVSLELDNKKIPLKDTIRANYNFNFLRIGFSPLNFLPHLENNFHVSIRGAKTKSEYISNNNEITLTGLPPGIYEIEIFAESNIMTKNSKPARFVVIINPPFWMTWWFYMVEAAVLGLIIWLIIIGITSRRIAIHKIEFEKIKAVSDERLRIASDMHDDLGSGLTSIRLLSEVAQIKIEKSADVKSEIKKIAKSTANLSQSLREIIWTMNTKYDNLEDFIIYTRSYVVDYFDNSPIDFRFLRTENVPAISISGELRRNIFLCIKEGLNNIVKHSKAQNASLSILIDNNLLTILINDNGIGINPSEDSFGNGLSLMKSRVEKFNGKLEIEVNNGSILTITIDLGNLPATYKK